MQQYYIHLKNCPPYFLIDDKDDLLTFLYSQNQDLQWLNGYYLFSYFNYLITNDQKQYGKQIVQNIRKMSNNEMQFWIKLEDDIRNQLQIQMKEERQKKMENDFEKQIMECEALIQLKMKEILFLKECIQSYQTEKFQMEYNKLNKPEEQIKPLSTTEKQKLIQSSDNISNQTYRCLMLKRETFRVSQRKEQLQQLFTLKRSCSQLKVQPQ